ncbi:hypothetical protein PoB_002656800 [Plakobranchus ocellatus]|uniref:Uncharacterized protein n=1 Tax=Plakobranchus ocellatus TaxID=259542 RepID=A0AAV4A023_9GAST|nr:hypothetical protein PoB_002656800 [Plakobranchus ocellatus]
MTNGGLRLAGHTGRGSWVIEAAMIVAILLKEEISMGPDTEVGNLLKDRSGEFATIISVVVVMCVYVVFGLKEE